MKLITRDTDYAIRAVCYIGKQDKDVVSVTELVASLKIPRPFLRKILQTLNKKGILRSIKGSCGGFSLASPCKRILLTDIMRSFQGDLSLNECYFKKHVCPHTSRCRLRSAVNRIEKYVFKQLGSINISQLIG